MRFYDEGTATASSDQQPEGPDSCSLPDPVASPEPVFTEIVEVNADNDTDTDTDDDTLVFDMDEDLAADTQPHGRRSGSPPPSPPMNLNIVTSNTPRADSLASSSSLHASPDSVMSLSSTEAGSSVDNMALADNESTASARDVISQPLCNDPLNLSSEYQPQFPLFQPAGADRLWYLGFLSQ